MDKIKIKGLKTAKSMIEDDVNLSQPHSIHNEIMNEIKRQTIEQEKDFIIKALLLMNDGEVTIKPDIVNEMLRRKIETGEEPQIEAEQLPSREIKLKLVSDKVFTEVWDNIAETHWFEGGVYSVEYEHCDTIGRIARIWKSKEDYEQDKEPVTEVKRDINYPLGHFNQKVRREVKKVAQELKK